MLKFILFVTFGIILSGTNAETSIFGEFGKEYKETVNENRTITISYRNSMVSILYCFLYTYTFFLFFL